MNTERKKIKIYEIKLPSKSATLDEKIEWLAESLGLQTKRDIEGSFKDILKEILILSKTQESFSLEDLLKKTHLSKTTVHHHIIKLRQTGIIYKEKNRFKLRGENLTATIEDLEFEIKKLFERIRKISEEIDKNI